MAQPKIYLIDIETSPNKGYTWGKWEQNVIWFEEEWKLLCLAYKKPNEKTTHCVSRLDFKDKSDKSLTKAAWNIFNEADVLIGHNIDNFDNKKLRAKFLEHGLKPPRPYKTIDTLKIARAQFAFTSNKLDDLAKSLGLGEKIHTGGHLLWKGCMDGDPKAWAKMIEYNKHDVVLLEEVYDCMKPWHPSHPNLTLYSDGTGCPVCSSPKVQKRGFQILRLRRAQRLHCQSCGHWFSRALES